MSGFEVRRIDDMEASFWGSFHKARAELGITSFGMQVLDLPPASEGYPEHDHAEDGQEEAYAVLSGGGEIEIDGQRHTIDPQIMVSVQPGTKRQVFPGPQGMRLLVVGGIPGRAYEIVDSTELGAPDPTAGQPPPSR
jgi:uncharacterized cupin superfamily protein